MFGLFERLLKPTETPEQPEPPAGLVGFYCLFDQLDTGNEETGFRLPSFPQFDIPLLFSDKVYDPSTGDLVFDLFNLDGILGDKFLVNGTIQPFFQVSPRRYRFRLLDVGPSRFYEFFLTDPNNLGATNPYFVIANDGNLLPAPVQVRSVRIGVAERVEFTGRVDVKQIYPRIDVLVLTSISEGLPLVILEAAAAGIPVVSTDVGACRELLEGSQPADRALGASGLVTGLADPGATAQAILSLARDAGLREEMGRAARNRVRAHYQESDLIRRYREIYADMIGSRAR